MRVKATGGGAYKFAEVRTVLFLFSRQPSSPVATQQQPQNLPRPQHSFLACAMLWDCNQCPFLRHRPATAALQGAAGPDY